MKFKFLGVGGIAVLIACAPTIDQRGYLADPEAEATIKTGSDSKTSVQDRLGYASTVANFGGETWYYISSTEKRWAFSRPRFWIAEFWRSISTRAARSRASPITA